MVAGWSAVAAFVPRPHVNSLFSVAYAKSDASTRICAAQGTTTPSDGSCASAPATRRIATSPAVLVGSDASVLETFAKHLSADSAPVINLTEVAMRDGSRGVEKALAGSKTDGVMICPANICLDHPEVRSLVRAHPLTVQLAISGEDKGTRLRCERATKYTVIVDTEDGDQSESTGDEKYTAAKADLSRLVAFARKPKPSRDEIELDMGKNTFFLSLTFEDFGPHATLLPELTEGVDAMELRVDLLANQEPYSVLRQLSILRRHTGYLPVVFTIRSKGQCGAFPDDPDALFRLARWGLRAGAEVMDIEANWPMAYRQGLIDEARQGYPGAVLVGSYHVVGRKTTEEQARALFMECYHDGAVDAIKVCCCCN